MNEMDTNDLTPMAYEVIIRAEDVLDVLRSEIGASAAGKMSEDEFLLGVQRQLRALLRSASSYLDDWGYLDEVEIKAFRAGVKNLLGFVEQTLGTPYDERQKWDTE